MSGRLRGILSASVLGALFLLHDDFWLADDPHLVLGLPVGLLYHVGFCVVTAAAMAVLVGGSGRDTLAPGPPRPSEEGEDGREMRGARERRGQR
jgi:hypothetical protein